MKKGINTLIKEKDVANLLDNGIDLPYRSVTANKESIKKVK